ncbi:MAG: PhoU domain-containing protein, partial [Clostridia bacterium]
TPEERLTLVSGFEQRMDDMTEQFRENQILRMRQGICSGEACVLYSEMLTDFERIGDHILNIGYDISRSNLRD